MNTLKIVVAFDRASYDTRHFINDIDPEGEVYVPVMGGHALGNVPEEFADMQGDDTGNDNLSELNPYLCEFTHMYWMWKNLDQLGNPNHVGLSHYRRVIVPSSWQNGGLKPNTICAFMRFEHPENRAFMNKVCPLQDKADTIINTFFNDQDSVAYLNKWKYQNAFPHHNMFIMETTEFDRLMQFDMNVLEMIQDVIAGSRDTGAYPVRAASWLLEYINGLYIDHAFNVRNFNFKLGSYISR